jgi:hypothetical protein
VQQLTLPSDSDRSAWERLLRVISDAVHYLGIKDVVFELNASNSTVSSALIFVKPKDPEDKKGEASKGDRHWRQEWTLRVLELLADRYDDTANQYIKTILDAQAAVTRRFEVVASDETMTEDEIATLDRLSAKAKRQKRRAA